MLHVFITVDTEVWPSDKNLARPLDAAEVDREIFGKTPRGDYGIGFQSDLLGQHGLKGVFFVESLFASAQDPGILRRTVDAVRGKGQDVELHLHSEWLAGMREPLLGDRRGQNMADFGVDEQTTLVRTGLENLRACGVDDVRCFRAGNYGANLDTLAALARNGIAYDTSHNPVYLGPERSMPTDQVLLQPGRMGGVIEFPVSFFEDRPGHQRHVQVAACSAAEMEHAIEAAAEAGWRSLVIVSHSFELIHRRTLRPDRIAIRRFERLCRVLADRPASWRTSGFKGIDAEAMIGDGSAQPLKSNPLRTFGRVVEQAVRRWFD